MIQSPSPRVLVAGIGNIFLNDDGFGVEVVRRLAGVAMPAGVTVADFGIRGIHLAYEILDGAYDEVVLVDAYAHGAAPGSIAVFEPEADAAAGDAIADAHSLDPASVLRLVRRLGGQLARIVVVGCEPAAIDEGIGLSAPVAAAVDEAVQTVIGLVGPHSEIRLKPDSTVEECR
jgi:hydrogenase maturation protease